MNNKHHIKLYFASSFVLLFVILSSCKEKEGEYHSIIDKIEAKSENYHGILTSSDTYLEDLKLIEITEGEHTFFIPERKSKIKSYSCTECHTGPLDKLQNNKKLKEAHWDIKLIHADKSTMNCATCHSGNDMNNLKSLTDRKISFNLSYKLCMQCHSPEFEDWKGGAHGKRLGGWANPRASNSCVDCHNPHKPGFETRFPSWYNTKTAEERE